MKKRCDKNKREKAARTRAKISIEQALERVKQEQLLVEKRRKTATKNVSALEQKTTLQEKEQNGSKNLEESVEIEVSLLELEDDDLAIQYQSILESQAYQRALASIYQQNAMEYALLWGFENNASIITDQYLDNARLEERQTQASGKTKGELGMLTQANAHAITVKLANMQLFSDAHGLSIEEREKYETWQRFTSNKVLRNIWRSSSSIQYNGNFLPMIHKSS